ncbi:hypothetical protein [Xylophilus sp.]|uniref:hypothetical protein n=1 Tax=Xylophilus sp. TaxID=2653893 RepID=UPI0013B74C42|nr:hypothetical protein [Xylophilus sp.]KAF1049335.1 MAG: hypothetical protein GAK38_00791 [Xylophilus sp.]
MSSPKTTTVQPTQPDAPAAKAIFGAEDSATDTAAKRKANRNALRATYLTAPATSTASSGVGVQL